ncbi:MAG: hypothetical protein FJ109_22165, partial [Deltaproteobacteria bacterium]|nr:hypothetical protein [Deltaproteobacteria bacterium]
MKILDGVGDRTLRSMLEAWSSKAPTELMVMSPYVTEEAARFLAAVARKVVKSKGRVRILAGTKQSFTDPGALEL